ncbi:MAG: low specificity L-threonine aldolase [Proteobacteria bacterium]|nr:low specificity L-threonine aldolase [Pseudomonadota bacterium]
MNFISDNAYGAAPQILASLSAANSGTETSYGEDAASARLAEKLAAIFEHEIAVFPVVTGTAANALALAALCPPYGAVLCHKDSHIAVDECAAPEFFTGGAKLAQLEGDGAKLAPRAIEQALARFGGGVHSPRPSAVSITQATELGTVYKLDEIRAIADTAHKHGMTLHMDGARFANALVSLGCTPAQMTWKAGVDALSFGATKNGALCAEAVIFFDKARAEDFAYRRKKAGHLVSKMRFISAQLEAYLENDLWLANARRANALAKALGGGLSAIAGVTLAAPVEANGVFAWMPKALAARLHKQGAKFYDWMVEPERVMARLIVSFATPEADVAKFIEMAKS